jgi:hypothetical protein
MIPRYVARAIRAWQEWRFEHGRANRARSLRSAIPALVGLDTKKAVLARQHRSGGRQIALERKRLVTERLRAELGRV